MDRSPFLGVVDVVRDRHLYSIPPVCFHQGTRKLVIDQNCTFVVAIRGYKSSGNGKVVTAYDPGVGNIVTGICSVCSSTTPWIIVWQRLAALSVSICPEAELRHHHKHYFRGTPGDMVHQDLSIWVYLR